MRRAGSWISITALLLGLASCTHVARSTHPPQTAGPSAQPTATPQPAPTPTPSPAPVTPPVITPTPGASAGAPVAPHITKKAARLAPDAAPQILAISISETDVKPGDSVSGNVLTSSNVASVEARIGGYAMSLHKVGVGRFQLTYKVIPLPWFIHGNFTMQVIARNTRGDAVARAIPLTVR